MKQSSAAWCSVQEHFSPWEPRWCGVRIQADLCFKEWLNDEEGLDFIQAG